MIYTMGESILVMMHTDVDTFQKRALVGPSNIARYVQENGSNAFFIGKLSNDRFGKRIKKSLIAYDIYHELEESPKQTSVAFVFNNDLDHSILFYRSDSADLYLDIEDLHTVLFRENDFLYVNSFGFVNEGTTQASHFHALNKCSLAGGTIVFDINYYEQLWNYELYAIETILKVINISHIVRLTEKECEMLSGFENVEFGLRCLQTNNQLFICVRDDNTISILHSDGIFSTVQLINRTFFHLKDAYAYWMALTLTKFHDNQEKISHLSGYEISQILTTALETTYQKYLNGKFDTIEEG